MTKKKPDFLRDLDTAIMDELTDNNSRLLVEGNLITKHDGKKEVKTADGGVWRRAAQITYVHITKDENGLEQLEAQGYMLSWWLNKRCIYPQIVATGTNQYLINLMVKNNCGSAAGTKRRFPLLTFLAQETIDGVAVEYANEVYAQLGQEVKARAQAGKLGYDILLNERERLFGFYLYKGNDLTATNAKTGETTGKGVFTIVEVKAGQGASAGWGRLKSGAGWISLDYATRLA